MEGEKKCDGFVKMDTKMDEKLERHLGAFLRSESEEAESGDLGGGEKRIVQSKKKVHGVEIDISLLDEQMEKHLNKLWDLSQKKKVERLNVGRSKRSTTHDITEHPPWEIDASQITLQSKIAQGTISTFYKGLYQNEEVAVKVFDGGLNASIREDEKESIFDHEVSVWHNLDHPNITKFLGAVKWTSELKIPSQEKEKRKHSEEVSCIVAEYVPGITLKSYLMKNRIKKLPFQVFLQLALDLARGLSYLHSKGIMHRGVKTDNILLDENTQKLKIVDLGVSCLQEKDYSKNAGMVGTLGYMAPEVLNEEPYDQKCDVYSFGMCLWEMYCCDMPFSIDTISDIESAKANQNQRPAIPKRCPKPLADIIERCWEGKSIWRPEMTQVVTLLEALDETPQSGCFCF